MGRRIDLDQLVGVTEIAARLGVASPHLVHDWRLRYADFPKPVKQLAMGLLWNWPDVERWARAKGRLG
jgi:chromosome partitioning protein